MITHRQIDSANNNRRQRGGCKQHFFFPQSWLLVYRQIDQHIVDILTTRHLHICPINDYLGFFLSFLPLPWSASSLGPCMSFCLLSFLHSSGFSSHSVFTIRIFSSLFFLARRRTCFRFSFSQFHLAIMSFFLPFGFTGEEGIFMPVAN